MDSHLIPSYSQFGEDRFIEAYFGSQERGIYVDIGCNHPISYSNTWKLYLRGWRGVCVDPNPYVIRKYKKVRPKDIAIQRVVSKKGIVEFYFSRVSHLISGVGEKLNGNWKRNKDNSDVVLCESVALSTILKECDIPNKFELLSIDVEGHEIEVLNSLDFTIYKPSLIVVEMHDFDLSHPKNNSIYTKLLSNGYSMKSYLTPNGFFALGSIDK
jgi:FkbM family methyltransferase